MGTERQGGWEHVQRAVLPNARVLKCQDTQREKKGENTHKINCKKTVKIMMLSSDEDSCLNTFKVPTE